MKYQRFEQLPVWQTAMQLAERVYLLTADAAMAPAGGLRDQLRRAAVSVSSNIAEGFERGTTAELLSFLYIARGSAGEVRSQLMLLERLAKRDVVRLADAAADEVPNLLALADSCGKQLSAWARQLQDSDLPGQRRWNAEAQKAHDARRSEEAFWEKVQQVRDGRAVAEVFGTDEEEEDG